MLDSHHAADELDRTMDRKTASKSSPSPSRTRKDSAAEPSTHDHNKVSTTITSSTRQTDLRGQSREREQPENTTTGTEKPADRSVSTTTTTPAAVNGSKTEAAASASSDDEDGTEESHRSKAPSNLTHDDTEEQSDNGPLVDMETFGQLLEMDDDEEHSFSKSLTWDYFDQAVTTFKEMDAAVLGSDLITLSRKGHFLKGSSAALGLNRVKASCEKMQHYGNKKRANGEGTLSEFEAMERCKSLLSQLKEEQKLSKAWLERFYAERNV